MPFYDCIFHYISTYQSLYRPRSNSASKCGNPGTCWSSTASSTAQGPEHWRAKPGAKTHESDQHVEIIIKGNRTTHAKIALWAWRKTRKCPPKSISAASKWEQFQRRVKSQESTKMLWSLSDSSIEGGCSKSKRWRKQLTEWVVRSPCIKWKSKKPQEQRRFEMETSQFSEPKKKVQVWLSRQYLETAGKYLSNSAAWLRQHHPRFLRRIPSTSAFCRCVPRMSCGCTHSSSQYVPHTWGIASYLPVLQSPFPSSVWKSVCCIHHKVCQHVHLNGSNRNYSDTVGISSLDWSHPAASVVYKDDHIGGILEWCRLHASFWSAGTFEKFRYP